MTSYLIDCFFDFIEQVFNKKSYYVMEYEYENHKCEQL